MDGGVGGEFEDGKLDHGRVTGRDRLLWTVRRHGAAAAGHAVRVIVWSAVHFLFGFAQQVAELFAPLLLVLGLGWYALPRGLAVIETSDSEMRDVLSGLADHVPGQIAIGDHVLTPYGLIVDGLLLMAIAAALSTLSALLSRELYRR